MSAREQSAEPAGKGYAGERLGLPAAGPGSMARLGARLIAVLVDWFVCCLIAAAFFGYRFGGGDANWAPLAVFLVENILLIGTLGFTAGQFALGLCVIRPGGTPAGPLAATIRSVLLCLFVPAIVWDRAGRGMHDRLAGTVIVRRR